MKSRSVKLDIQTFHSPEYTGKNEELKSGWRKKSFGYRSVNYIEHVITDIAIDSN